MAEIKIAADSGGGTVALKGPTTTNSDNPVNITLPKADIDLTGGSNGQYLKTNGSGTLSWGTIADNSITGDKIALGSDASGDIMYYNGTDYVRLAKGTDGQILKLASGAPSWAAAAAGGKIVQVKTDQSTNTMNLGASEQGSWHDFTGLSITMTPESASNKLLWWYSGQYEVSGAASGGIRFKRVVSGETNYEAGSGNISQSQNSDMFTRGNIAQLTFLDIPNTNEHTFTMQCRNNSGGTWYFGGESRNAQMIVMEYTP